MTRQSDHGRTHDGAYVAAQFLAKIEVAPSGCWLWTGAIDTNGYVHIRAFGRAELAHRYAYWLYIGEIPKGLHIDHLCTVRHCVNPDHLEPVTPRENIQRGWRRRPNRLRRKARPRLTHCKYGHELTPENVYVYDGSRTCRKCVMRRNVEYKARQRASA